MSVDMVGCPDKKAFNSADKCQQHDGEAVGTHHLHRQQQHAAVPVVYQCARHRFMTHGTDAVLDRIYPPESRVVIKPTARKSGDSTFSGDVLLVDDEMKPDDQATEDDDNATPTGGAENDDDGGGRRGNGPPDEKRLSFGPPEETGSGGGGAERDGQDNDGDQGGASGQGGGGTSGGNGGNDGDKKKKKQKSPPQVVVEDETDDTEEETEEQPHDHCPLGPDALEKKISNMTRDFLRDLSTGGAAKHKMCRSKSADTCADECEYDEECCAYGSMSLILRQVGATVMCFLQLALLLGAYICVCMARVLIMIYRAPRAVQVVSILLIAMCTCSFCCNTSFVYHRKIHDQGDTSVQVNLVVNDAEYEGDLFDMSGSDCSCGVGGSSECQQPKLGSNSGGGGGRGNTAGVPRLARPKMAVRKW